MNYMITLFWHFNCATDCNSVRLRLIQRTLVHLLLIDRNKTISKMGVVDKKKLKGHKKQVLIHLLLTEVGYGNSRSLVAKISNNQKSNQKGGQVGLLLLVTCYSTQSKVIKCQEGADHKSQKDAVTQLSSEKSEARRALLFNCYLTVI